MAFTYANGIVLHFSVFGTRKGPVLVFINSLGTDFRIWTAVSSAIAEHAYVVLYDKRGHGLSDVQPGHSSLDDHVDDLLGLLNHLEISRAVVIGLSIGGMIAQRLAVRSAERVSALALCDTAAKIGTPEFWANRMKAVEEEGLESIADAILERWFTRDFRKSQLAEFAGWRNMLIRTPITGYLGACAAIRDADLGTEAASIKVPTLCIVGDEDGATPPDLVRSLAASIPNAAFSVIESAGHLPCIEQPDILIQLIHGHLQESGIV